MRTRRRLVAVSLVVIAAVVGTYATMPAADAIGSSATRLSTSYSDDLVALSFSPIAGEDLWAGNGVAVYRSDDGGIRWTNITPTNLVGDDPTVRFTGFTSYGGSQLWFSATEAENVTPQHLRSFAIEHSADGGRTWSWTGVPTCSGCSMSLSFVSSTRGWALGSNGNLYETADGGTRWTLQPATAATAAASSGAIDFVDASSGWLANGRELYKTFDGARSWSRVELPAVGRLKSLPARLGSPHFFSPDNGILPATLSNGKAVVYMTSDAGRSWSYRSAPIEMGENSSGWWTPPSFSASSPKVWTISTGTQLYVTGTAGRAWSRITPPAFHGKGDPVWGFAMLTTSTGWLDAAATPCGDGGECAVPVLLRTTDAGHTWQAIQQPAALATQPRAVNPIQTAAAWGLRKRPGYG
jgi:photosystem II stability/assembly factor-like uncharacterized protein